MNQIKHGAELTSSFEKKTVYFSKAGEQNTDALLKFAKEYIEKEDIRDIIVASTTGETGAKAAKTFKGRNVVVVTHSFGFQELGKTELQEEHKKKILAGSDSGSGVSAK